MKQALAGQCHIMYPGFHVKRQGEDLHFRRDSRNAVDRNVEQSSTMLVICCRKRCVVLLRALVCQHTSV